MDKYLLNLKFTVSNYRFDLHCGMSADCGREISWFVPPLSLSQLCKPDHKKQFINKLLSNSKYRISETKTNFLPPR